MHSMETVRRSLANQFDDAVVPDTNMPLAAHLYYDDLNIDQEIPPKSAPEEHILSQMNVILPQNI